jgi:peptide deformylase
MKSIVTDTIKLKKVVTDLPKNKSEEEVISAALFTALKKEKGFGLSANQIGVDKRMCVINIKEPMVLVNPKIVKRSEEAVQYIESCLSLPKTMRKPKNTVRSISVTVETDNLGTVEFGPDEKDKIGTEGHNYFADEGLLECVVAQHEIDHLDGILITDSIRAYNIQRVSERKYGRNDKVMIKSPDGDTEFIKYKKAVPLLEKGYQIV